MFEFSFGNGLTIVHLERQNNRLVHAGYHLDCGYIRSSLRRDGITSVQYIQPNLSHFYDLVDELINCGHSRYLFHVTPSNYSLCQKLCSELKRGDSDSVIIWFGEWVSRKYQMMMERSDVDVCLLWEPELAISKVLQKERSDWGEIEGIAFRDGDNIRRSQGLITHASAVELDHLPSPYGEFAIPIRQQSHERSIKIADWQWDEQLQRGYMRKHSPARVKEEIGRLLQESIHQELVLHLQGSVWWHDDALVDELIPYFHSLQNQVKYRIELPLHKISRALVDRLLELPVQTAKIIIDDDFSNADYLSELFDKWAAKTSSPSCVIQFNDRTYNEADWQDITKICESILNQGWISAEQIHFAVDGIDSRRQTFPHQLETLLRTYDKSQPDAALMNGFMAFMTGMYPSTAIGSGVKHVGMNSDVTFSPDDYQHLQAYVGLNSAIVCSTHSSSANHNDPLHASLYYDEDGVLKQHEPYFTEQVNQAEQAGMYLSNVHQLKFSEEGRAELQLNDFFHHQPLDVTTLHYAQADKTEYSEKSSEDLCFLDIRTAEDLQVFLEDVEYFAQNGSFRRGYICQFQLLDSCRWSGAGQCHVQQLPRLFVEEDKQISPCRGCAKIGEVSSTLDQLTLSTATITEQEQLRRGCMTCEVRDDCSKCAFLPAYMDAETYCHIRKNHKILLAYQRTIQLYRSLKKWSQALKHMTHKDFRISLPTKSHFWPEKLSDNGSSRTEDHVFLFHIRHTPMIYQALSQKILKLNEPVALLFEGLMRGASDASLEDCLKQKYALDNDRAKKAREQAITLLSREGCLKENMMVAQMN